MSLHRSLVTLLAVLTTAGCGSAPGGSANAPIDEDRLARRVADLLFARISGEGEGESPEWAGDGARLGGADMAGAGVVRLRVPIDGAPSRGADQPLVTIVEFSDFECPFCSRVQPTIERLLETYPNEVRLVFRHNPLPFHQNAMPAAEAAVEAYRQRGDMGFWEMHDLLFENQTALGRPDLERYGQRIGLSPVGLANALDQHVHRSAIDADVALAARIGARGTPQFFINGRRLAGAQPFVEFETVVDEEIALAEAAMRRGVARALLYTAFLEGARDEPEPEPPPAPRLPTAPPDDTVYRIPVPPRAPARGSRNAPVTIQLFSDFQCPFCGRARPTIEQILQEYRGQVRLVWRNYPLPFHDNAQPAAEAAMEVFRQGGNDAFWAYHDLLFDNQRALSADDLERYASQVGGVDMNAFRAARDRRRHRASVEADVSAIQTAGARIGTPSFFINGRLIQGAQPFETFRAAIDRALQGDR